MKQVTIICDKCGLSIEPLDKSYPDQRVAGAGLLAELHYNGQMGHNQVPPSGWHFHYLCFSSIVATINRVLNGEE